jgi:hypothetical protein
MNVEIGTVAAHFLSWEYFFRIFCIGFLQCSLKGRYNKQGCRSGPPGWESITGLRKRFTITGSVFAHDATVLVPNLGG